MIKCLVSNVRSITQFANAINLPMNPFIVKYLRFLCRSVASPPLRLLDTPLLELLLIKSAVEELLRYTSPVFMPTERYAREDVTIEGVTIRRGEMALGVIGSANRDETVFDSPDTLDITREPNKHLSFGFGIHYYLGAPLARMEAQIAINTLLKRLLHLRLKGPVESLRWRPSLILRGLEALPVEFH